MGLTGLSCDYTVALAGNPNVGKSTVFNCLTGMKQHTGNWAGKTVELSEGTMVYRGKTYRLVDLPGTYSLSSLSAEEQVAEDYIRSGEAQAVIVVCDATCLERNLILALQVRQIHRKVLLCVNLMDEAEASGVQMDLRKLSAMLGIPVVGTAAGCGRGMEELRSALRDLLDGFTPTAGQQEYPNGEMLVRRAEEIAAATVGKRPSKYAETQRKADRFLTNWATGFPVLFGLLFCLVWLTVVGANYPSSWLQWAFDRGYELLGKGLFWVPDSLRSALLDGVYRTAARVMSVMVPPMAIFFPLFTFLEDIGYLPRVAFLLDHSLSACGSCGKQALSMCMGLGCNAVGVMGCRIIDSPRERTMGILTNSFMPCNGRFAALILLGSTALGKTGGFTSALLVTGLILAAVAATMAVCAILSRTQLRGVSSSFVLELPPFRKPKLGQILVRSVLDRTLRIAARALMVSAPCGLLLWLGTHYPLEGPSFLQKIAQSLDPIGKALGMNGAIFLAFLAAMPANELMLPVAVMLLGGMDLSRTTALCTMVFTLFHWPCCTTLLTIYQETGGIGWTLEAFFLPTMLGMGLCMLLNLLL